MLGPTLVRREPVGVVGAIVPWNVPLFVTMLKLAPALASGSTVVLKPAPETPLDAYLLAEAVQEAGLPAGVLNIVQAGREVGEHIVTHPDVDKISFTGSTAAGKRIAALCGEQLKRCTLELGGKSAAIILDDADLSTAIPGLMPNALMNNGEACVAQTRILASRARYDEVVDALAEAVSSSKVGEPLDQETAVGPLFASRQRDRVEGYIAKGKEEGARIVTGGGRPAGFDEGLVRRADAVRRREQPDDDRPGGDLRAGARRHPLRRRRRRARASPTTPTTGSPGSVWTSDPQVGVDVARQVRTGTYGVNGMGMDFASPFGGFKQSGVGRELGPEGLEAFLESKTIVLPAGFEPV